MPRITVRPHHDRWGLYEDGVPTPVAEYDTRELAELAARDRGDEVVVEEGRPRDSATEPQAEGGHDAHPRAGGAGPGGDAPREEQAGL
jgi:hypothetical protein